MSRTITIDPLTRIEGHLKIKVEVEKGKVIDAYSAGEMFRGWEVILKDRDPMDAPMLTQRVCGVCPQSHGNAAVLALDDAYNVNPPTNGRVIRNLMLGANFIQSNILHFYHLAALDFVDITAILKYTGNDKKLLKIRDWVKAGIESGDPFAGAPFLPRYEGNYLKDYDANIQSIANYVDALEMRKKSHEMLCIFGGKMPHVQTIFPGGVSVKPTVNSIAEFKYRLKELSTFVDDVYIPNVVEVAKAFPEYASIGKGSGNHLAYGVFKTNNETDERFLPPGIILDGKLQDLDVSKITEHIKHAKFSSGSQLHPSIGETIPAPEKEDAYSWIKSPRYNNNVMEVGPLSRVLMAYMRNSHPSLNSLVDSSLEALKWDVNNLYSVLGRHAARALETKVLADEMFSWIDQLDPDASVHTSFNKIADTSGVGLTEAPRGALGHWVNIKNGVIDNYEMIVPTTWNASPRDDNNMRGTIEEALIGIEIADPENPIEVGRVVRSYDPCLSCAIHLIDNGKDIGQFKVT